MQRKLLVTAEWVGVIVDVKQEDAATEVAAARDFLGDLSLGAVPEHRSQAKPAAKAKALSGRILALGSSYFGEPRESTEISKELARSAHHYKDVRVRVELGRMVQRGMLRRIGDGTKAAPYKYVNP